MRSIKSRTWLAGALAVLAMGAAAAQAASLLPPVQKSGKVALFLWPAGTGESKS